MMKVQVPERCKRHGVRYALTEEGVELPVIDISHPAFRLPPEASDVPGLRARLERETARWERYPGFVQRFLGFLVQRQSILLKGLLDPGASFLSGMNTYLMKLGPGNLGKGYTGRLDPKVAASVQALGVRMRLEHMARLIADGLAPALAGGEAGTLQMVNIAGGPVSDTLNALVLIRKEHPQWLEGRAIHLRVLDLDGHGPAFGARALEALAQEGAPLHGLSCSFERIPYDWNQPALLREALAHPDGTRIVAGSSEGGLFEYGTDQAIAANLEVLGELTPPDFAMTGSMLMDTPLAQASQRFARLPLRLFSTEAFAALAGGAGWTVGASLEGPTIRCVRLIKRAARPGPA